MLFKNVFISSFNAKLVFEVEPKMVVHILPV